MKTVLLLPLLLLAAPQIPSAAQGVDYALSPAQIWIRAWAVKTPLLMAGDVEGNRRADLISITPEDGDIHILHTSSVGKPEADMVALGGFAQGAVAAACGQFGATKSGGAADAVVALLGNGEVRIAADVHADDQGKLHVFRNTRAAMLTPAQMPTAPVEMVVGDFDGDGLTDILLIGADRHALLLRASRGEAESGVQFTPLPVATPFPVQRQIGAGMVSDAPTGDRRTRLFYIDESGVLFRSALTVPGGGKPPRLAPGVRLLDGISLDARLAVGHFRGAPESDLIVGTQMLAGADPNRHTKLSGLPSLEDARSDRAWLVADLDGNGKDDLARSRGTGDVAEHGAALIHFSWDPGHEPAAGYLSSANDGLLDLWKHGGVHPGGLDLKALGCKVGQFDMLIEVIPATDVPTPKIAPELEKVSQYYASLPMVAPDHSTGIHVHYIYRDPTPEGVNQPSVDPSDVWMPLFQKKLILPEHVGVVHYLGLQKGNRGGASERFWTWASLDWRVIVHEMGHQLGLSHGGREPMQEMSAMYPSLMNYAYGYGIDGSATNVGYSTGALAGSVPLNEEHLNKTLSVPYAKAKFMAGAPYHFHLKPGNDPNTTLIDWNWDGDFNETDVRADINYSQGIVMTPKFDVGHSYTTPIPVTQTDAGGKSRLMLIAGMTVPGANGVTNASDLGPHNPGRIVARVWEGTDRDTDGARWSQPYTIAKSGVIGDASAVSVGDATFVAYPTVEGVTLCRLTLTADGKFQSGGAVLVPNTTGLLPALAACGPSHLALTLWRDPATPITLRLLSILPAGDTITTTAIGGEISLGILSAAPVATIAGATDTKSASGETNALWVARMAGTEGGLRAFHFEACRFDCANLADRPSTRLADRRWVYGNYVHRRPTLLWEPEPALGPQGRLYVLAGQINKTDPEQMAVSQFCAMQTAYPTENEGWLLRRYDKVTFVSRSAPGACWFEGNMVYAQRTNILKSPSRSDTVSVSFRGTGATPEPTGDFNDLAYITSDGLTRGIETVKVP